MEYARREQRIFGTDMFGSSGDKRKIFVLVSGDGEEDGDLYAVMVLHLFRIITRGSFES